MTDELSPPEQRRIRALFRTRSSSSPIETWHGFAIESALSDPSSSPAASRQDSATTTAAPEPPAGAASTHTTTTRKEGSKP